MTFESPLKYLNQDGEARCHAIFQNRPAQTNNTTLKIGTFWIDQDDERVELLASYSANQGNYILVGDGPTSMETLTGDVGGAVNPSSLGNIDIRGGQTSVVGTPASNLLTFSFTETDPTFGTLDMTGDITFEGGTVISETNTGSNDTWTVTSDIDTSSVIHKLATNGTFSIRNGGQAFRFRTESSINYSFIAEVSTTFNDLLTFEGGSVISETNTGTNDVWALTADSTTTNIQITLNGDTSASRFQISNQSSPVWQQAGISVSFSGSSVDVTGVLQGPALSAEGDLGGEASTVSFTNVVDTGVSTGTMTINTTTASNGSNDGYLKFLRGNTPTYTPIFDIIAP